MRGVVIVIVQLVLAVFLTASLMPLLLVGVPAAQTAPRLGVALMVALCAVLFAAVALVWPRKRK